MESVKIGRKIPLFTLWMKVGIYLRQFSSTNPILGVVLSAECGNNGENVWKTSKQRFHVVKIQTQMITVTKIHKSSRMVDVFVGIKGHFKNLFNYFANHTILLQVENRKNRNKKTFPQKSSKISVHLPVFVRFELQVTKHSNSIHIKWCTFKNWIPEKHAQHFPKINGKILV